MGCSQSGGRLNLIPVAGLRLASGNCGIYATAEGRDNVEGSVRSDFGFSPLTGCATVSNPNDVHRFSKARTRRPIATALTRAGAAGARLFVRRPPTHRA